MTNGSLDNLDLFIDDFHKLRVLDVESADQSNQLTNECERFVHDVKQFKNVVDNFIEEASQLSDLVEREKCTALNRASRLKSMNQQRDFQISQLQALITEKKVELERLRIEYESLMKVQHTHEQSIDDFFSQK